jgi:hypothetical protein
MNYRNACVTGTRTRILGRGPGQCAQLGVLAANQAAFPGEMTEMTASAVLRCGAPQSNSRIWTPPGKSIPECEDEGGF